MSRKKNGSSGSRSGRYSTPGYQPWASVNAQLRRAPAERVAGEVTGSSGSGDAGPELAPADRPEGRVHRLLAGAQVVQRVGIDLGGRPAPPLRLEVRVDQQQQALRAEAGRVEQVGVGRR